jgi:uncharacterized Zn finger protein
MACGTMGRVTRISLTEQQLLDAAGQPSFGRGEDYVRYVRGARVEGTRATGSIQARNVYTVSLDWSSGEPTGSCTCPHHGGGAFCKHLVALGLAVIDAATGSVPETTSLDVQLAALTEADVRSLLRDLAERDDGVRRLVEVRASARTGDPAVVAEELVGLVTSALSQRGYIDYRRSFEVARDAQELLDELERHLSDGGADLVRAALLRALTRLRAITLQADDSSGSIGDACQRAADLYARSCVEGAPDRMKLARWLAKFRDDSPGWPHTPLPLFVGAFDAPALAAYRRAVDALDRKHATQDHWQRFEVDAMQLELADHDGDVDLAIELLSRGEHPEYGAIVRRLRAAGRDADAVSWLDLGVAAGRVSGGRGGRNEFWLDPDEVAATYVQLGRADDALAVLRGEFERRPGRTTYWKLLDLAADAGRWDEERAWALGVATVPAKRAYGDGSVLVDLALASGDLEAAWAAARSYGAGSAWRALADASAETRPVEAAALYRAQVERLVVVTDTKRYREIAELLAAMHELSVRGGAEDESGAYLAALRETYRRRTSMMAELDRQKLP